MYTSDVQRARVVKASVPENVFLRIADIVYAIVSIDPFLKLHTEVAIQKFIVDEGNPHVSIEARLDDLSTMKKGDEKIFDSGALWQLYKYNGGYLFSLTSPSFGSTPYKVARVNKDFTRGEVLLHRTYFDKDQPVDPLQYPLDELLFTNYLSLGRGAEVHSCGIVDSSKRGHLFVGQSGAGKTTMAKLWQDVPDIIALSDDRIVLRKSGEKIWMYGTPWHGDAKIASPDRAPLTQVYFLSKGTKNGLIPLSKTDATARFFACSFLPFYNPEAIEFSLGFFEEVVRTVPCYELRFVPDKKVVEFIQKYGIMD